MVVRLIHLSQVGMVVWKVVQVEIVVMVSVKVVKKGGHGILNMALVSLQMVIMII